MTALLHLWNLLRARIGRKATRPSEGHPND